MPRRELTETEKASNKAERITKEYMEGVREFLMKQNNGTIPPEYSCSLMMLQAYYKQFIMLSAEIDNLDSLMVDSRYGLVPNPLLKARDATVAKLDVILRSLGCTFTGQYKMKLVDNEKEEETPFEKIMKQQIETR